MVTAFAILAMFYTHAVTDVTDKYQVCLSPVFDTCGVSRNNHQSYGRHNLHLHENVVAGGEGDTDEDEEEVGDGEVQDQQVRCVLHLRVRHHLLQGGGGEKAKTNCELA